MLLSINFDDLSCYISKQLSIFFPDKYDVKPDIKKHLNLALSRVEYCFSKVAFNRYSNDINTFYNHLYSDHHLMLIWFISNSVWKETENINLASKLYYLNKSLHGFDCMYNTNMPDIFLIFHGVGTMLGKAEYSDYFVAFQGCTIGSHQGKYPNIGKGVALTAHSSLIGDCKIGNRVSISAYTNIFQKDIEADNTVFRDNSGIIVNRESNICFAQQFFKTDLTLL